MASPASTRAGAAPLSALWRGHASPLVRAVLCDLSACGGTRAAAAQRAALLGTTPARPHTVRALVRSVPDAQVRHAPARPVHPGAGDDPSRIPVQPPSPPTLIRAVSSLMRLHAYACQALNLPRLQPLSYSSLSCQRFDMRCSTHESGRRGPPRRPLHPAGWPMLSAGDSLRLPMFDFLLPLILVGRCVDAIAAKLQIQQPSPRSSRRQPSYSKEKQSCPAHEAIEPG